MIRISDCGMPIAVLSMSKYTFPVHIDSVLTCDERGLAVHSGTCTGFFSTEIPVIRPFTTDSSIHYDPTLNTSSATYGTKFFNPLEIYWQATDLSHFDYPYASALASRLKIKLATTSTPRTASVSLASLVSTPPSPASSVSTSSLPLSTSPGVSDPSKALSRGAIAIVAFVIYKYLRRRKGERTTNHAEEAVGTELPELVGCEHIEGEKHEIAHEGHALIGLASPVSELEAVSERQGRGLTEN
jgi:hypothetical protein